MDDLNGYDGVRVVLLSSDFLLFLRFFNGSFVRGLSIFVIENRMLKLIFEFNVLDCLKINGSFNERF